MSDFSGLRLALDRAAGAATRVNVAAQNVANANTPGYTRQAVNLVNIGAPADPGPVLAVRRRRPGRQGRLRHALSRPVHGDPGRARARLDGQPRPGVDDDELDPAAVQRAVGRRHPKAALRLLGGLRRRREQPRRHGASRTQLLQRADTLAASFNSISRSLTQQKTDTISELGATVADINSKAQSIAQLNQAIKTNTIAGSPGQRPRRPARPAREPALGGERRDAARRRLQPGQRRAQRHRARPRRHVDGVERRHVRLRRRACAGRPTTRPRRVTSGKAGGELDAINGTIPNYIAKLDSVATTLRDQVNAAAQRDRAARSPSPTRTRARAGNLQFDVALDNGAFDDRHGRRRRLVGRRRRGRAADRAADRGRHRDRRRERDRHRVGRQRRAR